MKFFFSMSILMGLVLAQTAARGFSDEGGLPGKVVSADFKLVIEEFGIGPEPIATDQFLSHQGRIYYITSDDRAEVIVFDPPLARVEVLDLKRRAQSKLSLALLDASTRGIHDSIAKAAAKRKKLGGRGNEVAAAMSRDLIDPTLKESFDAMNHRLRLTNDTVDVTAAGEPDSDLARLGQIERGLLAVAKLEAMRDPEGIPPFSRLAALHAVIATHRLRPSELSLVFRLTGSPKKQRWTFRLVTAFTAREIEAISLINGLRARSRFVRFDEYERLRGE